MSFYYCGLIVGCQLEGYSLCFPLIVLAEVPEFLASIYLFKKGGLFWSLILFQCFLSCFLIKKYSHFIFVSFLFLLPFLCGFLLNFKNKEQHEKWLSKIEICFPPGEKDPYERAQKITYKLIKLLNKNKNVSTILMPESTFAHPINLYPKLVSMWEENALKGRVHLIFGSHRQEGGSFFNCIMDLHQGRITQSYDKKKCLFLTERIPNIPIFKNLLTDIFLKKSYVFLPGKDDTSNVWKIEGRDVDIAMCSEFFVPRNLSDFKCRSDCIACFVNDSWFSTAYMPRLMFLYAKMLALEKNKMLFYVGHKFKQFCF